MSHGQNIFIILGIIVQLSQGMPVVPAGWPILATLRAGKPTFIVELVGTGYVDDDSVRIGVLGLLNVLSHLGMLDGAVVPLPGLKVPPGRYGRRFVIFDAGGIIHFTVCPGDRLEAGTNLAILRDIYGDIIGEVTFPVAGYVRTLLFGAHNAAVYEGAVVASILEVDPTRRHFCD